MSLNSIKILIICYELGFIRWVLSLKRAKQQTPNLHDESSNLSGPAINQRRLDDEVNFYSKVRLY